MQNIFLIISFFSILGLQTLFASEVETVIPDKANTFKEIIDKERTKYWPELEEPAYIPALIEHESCISLTHSRCWTSKSEFRTPREQGVGLGQVTRTWYKNGQPRFDTLKDYKKKYKTALKGVDWSNIKSEPEYQIRLIMLMNMENWNALSKIPKENRLAFSDSAYNGGLGAVKKDIQYCSLKDNCDHTEWFGNVEINSLKSRKILYGDRSPYDINRHHVRDVLLTRLDKYRKAWYPEEVSQAVPDTDNIDNNDPIQDPPQPEEKRFFIYPEYEKPVYICKQDYSLVCAPNKELIGAPSPETILPQ